MDPIQIDDGVVLPPRGVKGGLARGARTKARAAMPAIYDEYQAWMRGERPQYKDKPDFCNSVSDKYLIDATTVNKWILKYWEQGAKGW